MRGDGVAALRARWHSARGALRGGDGLIARFARGTRWNTVAVGFTVGTNFLGNVLFARILGQTEFGGYGLVQTTLMTAVGLSSQFGSSSATRYVAQFRWAQKERAGRVIALNILVTFALSGSLGLALALSAPWLAANVFHSPDLVPAVLIAAAIVPIMNVNAVNLGALAGFENFSACARITGIGSVAYLVTGAAGAVMFGVPGAIVGGLAGLSIQCALSFHTLFSTARAHGVKVQLVGAWEESKILFKFNLPSLFAGITPMGAIWAGQLLLVQRARGYDELALYSAANTLRSSVVILPYILYTVTSSLINSYQAQGERERFRRVFWLNVYSTVAIALGIASLCAITAPWLLSIFGEAFVPAASILLILLCGGVLESTVASIYQIIQARELLWQALLLISLPRDLSIIGLGILLVPQYGPHGLAAAYVGGWIIGLMTTSLVVWRAGIEPSGVPTGPVMTPSVALQE